MASQEKALPYALTSLQRVKDLIFDPSSQSDTFDTVLTREINAVSDYLESQTGRRFLLTQYTNDEMSGISYKQRRIVLRQYPVFYKITSGNLTNGSPAITNVPDMNGVKAGMVVYVPGTSPLPGTLIFQNGSTPTTVVSVTSNSITLSQNATYTQTGASIQISGLIELDYLSGTPVTNPAWTPYIPDQYKLKDFGRAGIIRVYGYIQRIYDSSIRATYWAGYLINWQNAGDNLTHTLPADITRTAENLVVRRFQRRQKGDMSSQSLGGSNVTWEKDLTKEDRDTILRYKRMPIYF